MPDTARGSGFWIRGRDSAAPGVVRGGAPGHRIMPGPAGGQARAGAARRPRGPAVPARSRDLCPGWRQDWACETACGRQGGRSQDPDRPGELRQEGILGVPAIQRIGTTTGRSTSGGQSVIRGRATGRDQR